MTTPEAGLVDSKAAPSTAGSQAPSMNRVDATSSVARLAVAETAGSEGTGAPARTNVGLLHPRRPTDRARRQSAAPPGEHATPLPWERASATQLQAA